MELILLDLDETLLRSDKTISDYSIKTLKRCQSAGILVGFCTSRGKVNLLDWEKQVAPDVVICNGGASIFHKDNLLHTESFSVEQTQAILAKAYEICGKDCEITLDTLDNIFWNRGKDKSEVYADWATIDDFSDFSEPALKICVQTDDPNKAKQIAQAVKDCDYLPFSDIPWYKFSSGNATKEHAIKILAKKLNINLAKTIAFGDDFNDIGMLKLCGRGIAMGNAIEQVKLAADDTTRTNNEDGVAWYLEKHLL